MNSSLKPVRGDAGWRQNGLSLREVVSVLFRHKGKMTAFFLLVVGASVAILLLIPSAYKSEAKIFIKIGRESASIDPSITGPSVGQSISRSDEIQSEMAILHSRVVAEHVIDTIGAERFLPPGAPKDQVVKPSWDRNLPEWLQSAVKVIWSRDKLDPKTPREMAIRYVMDHLETTPLGNIITLSISTNSPALSKESLDELLNFYQHRHIEVHTSQAPPQFFERESDTAMNELKKSEEEFKKFRADHNLISLDPQKAQLVVDIARLRTAISEATVSKNTGEARTKALQDGIKRHKDNTEVSRKSSAAGTTIANRVAEMRVKLAETEQRYPPTSREILDLKDQIKASELALSAGDTSMTDVSAEGDIVRQQLELTLETQRAEQDTQQAKLAALKQELDTKNGELQALVGNEFEFKRLERQTAMYETRYREFADGWNRSLVSAALDKGSISNVTIVQPPTLPVEYDSPRRGRILGLMVFLAFWGSIALAFLMQAMDHSLKSIEDVERYLQLPVFASIPRLQAGRTRPVAPLPVTLDTFERAIEHMEAS